MSPKNTQVSKPNKKNNNKNKQQQKKTRGVK